MIPPADQWMALAWAQLWQVTALIAAVGIVVRLVCRRRPHLAHLLWILVLVKCLTPPVWSSPIGLFSWAQVDVRPARSDPAAEASTHGLAPLPPADRSVRPAAPVPASLEHSGEALLRAVARPRPSVSAGLLLGQVWLLGVAVLGGLAVLKSLRDRRQLKASTVPTPAAAASTMEQLRRHLGVRRKVRLLVASGPIGPAAYGVLRPTIVMPEAMLREKSPGQLRPILAHELTHVRRGDAVLGWLQLAVQLVWWFHPLVWWANRKAAYEAERCCDEEVIAGIGCRPTAYVSCLLDVLESGRNPEQVLALPGPLRARTTVRRLEDIMRHAGRFHRRTPLWCWAVMLVAAALVLPGGRLVIGAGPQASGQQSQPEAARVEAAAPVERPETEAARDAGKPDGRHYVVVPVTTALQRIEAGRDAQAYVLVNGDALDKKVLDAEAFNAVRLHQLLASFAGREKGSVYFYVRRIAPRGRFYLHTEAGVHSLRTVPPGEREPIDYVGHVLAAALEGIGRRAGFRDAVAQGSSVEIAEDETPSWESILAELNKGAEEDAGLDEPPMGDDLVQVYPVRTRLSRFIYRGADCVVHIVPPINDVEADRAKEIPEAVDRCVSKLKLKDKRLVAFLYSIDQAKAKAGSKSAVRVDNLMRPSYAQERLGFKSAYCRYLD